MVRGSFRKTRHRGENGVALRDDLDSRMPRMHREVRQGRAFRSPMVSIRQLFTAARTCQPVISNDG